MIYKIELKKIENASGILYGYIDSQLDALVIIFDMLKVIEFE